MSGAIYICGGDFRPGPRDACPDDLHDWPLPAGYVDAAEVAQRRLNDGWSNWRCPDCGLYGWRVGRRLRDADVRVEVAR